MAENESLDLNSPYAWRWNRVKEAALKATRRRKSVRLARRHCCDRFGRPWTSLPGRDSRLPIFSLSGIRLVISGSSSIGRLITRSLSC